MNRWYNGLKGVVLRVGKDSLYDMVRYLVEAFNQATVCFTLCDRSPLILTPDDPPDWR